MAKVEPIEQARCPVLYFTVENVGAKEQELHGWVDHCMATTLNHLQANDSAIMLHL